MLSGKEKAIFKKSLDFLIKGINYVGNYKDF